MVLKAVFNLKTPYVLCVKTPHKTVIYVSSLPSLYQWMNGRQLWLIRAICQLIALSCFNSHSFDFFVRTFLQNGFLNCSVFQ